MSSNQGPWSDPAGWSAPGPPAPPAPPGSPGGGPGWGPPQPPQQQWGPPPGPPQPQGAPPEPPQSIRTAALLMYVGAALTVLSFVVGLTQLGDVDEVVREELREEQGDLTEDEFETMLTIAKATAYGVMFISLAFAGIWVWMAVMNSRGRGWARIVAAILGGLNIALTLLGLVVGAAMGGVDQTGDIEESPIGTVLGIASAGLAAIILILLFQAASTAYYNAVTHWRTPRWG